MFNEREVCRQVIEACCELEWPRDALMVQVLDDSTDVKTRQLVDDKVRADASTSGLCSPRLPSRHLG